MGQIYLTKSHELASKIGRLMQENEANMEDAYLALLNALCAIIHQGGNQDEVLDITMELMKEKVGILRNYPGKKEDTCST